ncbi:MAG TPA: hypothetical protein VFS07_05650 [Gemmatimonadales bacterium]|nr:hypothetical protein [Gemmatimonadales bacterium]
MTTLFDRLDTAAQQLGKKVQAAAETLRIQSELFRLQGRRRTALEELGRLAHTEARQGSADAAAKEVLLAKVDELDAQVAKLEAELGAAKGEVVAVHER